MGLVPGPAQPCPFALKISPTCPHQLSLGTAPTPLGQQHKRFLAWEAGGTVASLFDLLFPQLELGRQGRYLVHRILTGAARWEEEALSVFGQTSQDETLLGW